MNKFKYAMLVTCLVAGSAIAATTNVTSRNVVGYMKVNIEPAFNMLAFNWKDIGGGEVSIQDLFDTSTLHGGGGYDDSDNIVTWNAVSQSYEFYWLRGADGLWYTYSEDLAVNTFKKGDAFWFVRKAGAMTNTISGEVDNDQSNVVSFTKGYTMFGSAFASEMDVNGAGNDWTGCQGGGGFDDADNILIWDAVSQGWVQLWLRSGDGNWYTYAEDLAPIIPLGQGMWFYHKPDGAGTWIETRPYTL